MGQYQGPGGPGYPPPEGQGYPPQEGQGYPPPGGPGYPPPPGWQGAPQQPGGPGYPPPPGYPPQYGGPPPGGYQPQVAPAPAGIGGLFQKWIRVTTKPGVQSFANELPTANWGDVWLSIIGLGVLTAITTFIGSLYLPNTFLNGLTPEQQRALGPYMHPTGAGAFGSIIGVPIGFFIVTGIVFLFAKMFGGSGSFLQQSYAFALFYVPVAGAAAILGLVPVLGTIAGALLGIYNIVLAIFAVAASHRLSTGRSVAVVLLPLAVVLLLVCIAVFILIAVIAAAIQNTR